MAAVEQILSETLKDLSYEEREKFKLLLHLTYFQKSLPQIPWTRLKWVNRADLLVDLMVRSHGQQSVEVIKEVFMDMNRTDLAERLSELSSGLKGQKNNELPQNHMCLKIIHSKKNSICSGSLFNHQ